MYEERARHCTLVAANGPVRELTDTKRIRERGIEVGQVEESAR